jgi:hypothetical protein
VVMVAGAALLWASSTKTLDKHPAWQGLLAQLGGIFVVLAGISLLWELAAKRAFASEIFAVARVSTDVRNAGLTRVGTSYLDDVDWETLFATVEKLDVFVAYASTWRGANYARLRKVAQEPTSRIRIYLPDPQDNAIIQRLGRRFDTEPEVVQRKIIEARGEFGGLQQAEGGEVLVRYHSGDPLFSCYRFDRVAILTLYSHQRARTDVPTLVCQDGGTLYDFVRKELKSIEEQSRPAE